MASFEAILKASIFDFHSENAMMFDAILKGMNEENEILKKIKEEEDIIYNFGDDFGILAKILFYPVVSKELENNEILEACLPDQNSSNNP